MSLEDWLKNGWLVEHQTSRQEMVDLLAMADRDLAQSLASLKPSEAFVKTRTGFLFFTLATNALRLALHALRLRVNPMLHASILTLTQTR